MSETTVLLERMYLSRCKVGSITTEISAELGTSSLHAWKETHLRAFLSLRTVS